MSQSCQQGERARGSTCRSIGTTDGQAGPHGLPCLHSSAHEAAQLQRQHLPAHEALFC